MSGEQKYMSFFTEFMPGLHNGVRDFIQQNSGLEYFGLELPNADYVYHQSADALIGSWAVCIVLIALALLARMQLSKAVQRKGLEKYHADSGFSFRNLFEVYTGFIYGLLADNLSHKDARTFFWFFGGLFIYIFFSNLIGVLPGGTPPTQSFSNNLVMSLVVLVLFVVVGIIRQGIGYFTHMAGPVLVLAPLIFVIEIFGAIFVRPGSLTLRLTGNMNGDHAVLGVTYTLSEAIGGIGLPVAALCLGTFVAFLQAFVFTLLSIVYVVLSVEHDDEHH